MFPERTNISQEAEALRASIANEAIKWLGAPSILYRGFKQGVSPEGFDCSGFVRFVLQEAGVELPEYLRHTNQFFDSFGVLVHWSLQKRGDLVFFSKNGLSPTHMGIVLDPQRFVHAPGKEGSEVEIGTLMTKPIRDLSEEAIYAVNPIGFKRFALSDGRWKRF